MAAGPGNQGPGLDSRQVRRAFARAAASFDAADVLQTEVRERLLERLTYLDLKPRVILDLGAGTGRAIPALRRRFPAAEILAVDLVPAMLAVARQRSEGAPDFSICGDAARLPLPDGSVDLVFSNLAVHWCPSIDGVFAEVRRVLRYPGVFLFSTLGPLSFQELRTAWSAADDRPHVMVFPELRALGDGLVRAGLGEPVMDADCFTIRYRDIAQLTADLKETGTTNPMEQRRRGLTGPRAWQRMTATYEEWRDADGKLPATVEVLQGQAWAPHARAGAPSGAGEISVPLGELRRR